MANDKLFNALRKLEDLRGIRSKFLGKLADRIENSIRLGVQDLKDYKGASIDDAIIEERNTLILHFAGVEPLRMRIEWREQC